MSYQVTVEFYTNPNKTLKIVTDSDLNNCDADMLMSELDSEIRAQLGDDLADDIASVDYGI